jgi:hypothetical protein
MRVLSVRGLVVVALVSLACVGIAGAAGPIVLGDGGDLHEGVGQADLKTKLESGSVYTASKFPVPLKIHAPGPLWGGVQLESGKYRFIQLGHQHVPGTAPLTGTGLITLESATSSTPSAARTLANLRATPKMRAGPTRATRVAGRRASMFDATITAIDRPGAGGLAIVPFTVNHHCGFCTKTMHGETKDVKVGRPGQLFHILVLRTRGRTVVIYVESNYADQKRFPPTKTFPTFLPYAQKMLAAISFS